MALTWHYFLSQGSVVAAPAVVALGAVVLLRGGLQAAHFDVSVLDAAARLIGAYMIVRLAVLLFAASLGNKSWMQTLGKPGHLVHLAGDRRRIPGLARSHHRHLGQRRRGLGQDPRLRVVGAQTAVHPDPVRAGRGLDQPLGRTAPEEAHAISPPRRASVMAKFANAFLIGLSILMGLNAAGVDLTALTVLTGAIGLGLGFGLQSIAANFVSGFVLLMDRSIKPGDVISLSGQTAAPAPRISAGCRSCAAAMWWCAIGTAWKCWCRTSSSFPMP